MLTLGNYDGYGWYRTHFDSPRGGRARLLFSDVADRVLVWLNGQHVGTSATPPEDRKGKFPAEFEVQLEKGPNALVVLVDNLGLAKGDWQIGRPQHLEAKGLLGPVHVSNLPEALRHWQFLPKLSLEREVWSDEIFINWPELAGFPKNQPTYFATQFDWSGQTSRPLRIDLSQMHKGLAWLNGRLLGRYWHIGPETRLYLPEPWIKSRNTLVLFDEAGTSPETAKLVWDEKNKLHRTILIFK
jgi:beta-galactosidase